MPGKGFGFIDYRTPHQAKEALDCMNGRLFMTKSLHIEYSKQDCNRSDTPQHLIHNPHSMRPRGQHMRPRGQHMRPRGQHITPRGHHYGPRGPHHGPYYGPRDPYNDPRHFNIFQNDHPRDTPRECHDNSEDYPEKPSRTKIKRADRRKKKSSSNSNEVSFEFGSCVFGALEGT